MTPLELLICTLLIVLSGYLSASEIALFSLSRFQLRSLKESFQPTYRKIKRLLSDPGGLLITLLVCNEMVNVALSSLITKVVSRGDWVKRLPLSELALPLWVSETLIGILIATPILLFLCEVTPKVIATRTNRLVATLTVGPLTFVYRFFKPIRFVLKKLIHFFYKLDNKILPQLHSADASKDTILRESDFLLMLEEGYKEGAIQESELELIRNVFELDTTPVSEISTPLSQVLSFPFNTSFKAALAAVQNKRYSRIPITSLNRKEVLGVLYSKDLLRIKTSTEYLSATVATQMRKPFFVISTLKVNALFRKFKQYKTHMAIVKNPEGEVVGVVTMSDVLDMLFENFLPDDEEKLRRSSAKGDLT